MSDAHFTDDELLELIYEVGRGDGHLGRCELCRERWENMTRVRRHVLEAPAISDFRLAEQRARIEQRLVNPLVEWPRTTLRPALAWTVAAVLAAVLSLPGRPPTPVMASGDAQLLREIYSMIQSDAPRAATPVQGLFETKP